MNAHYPDWWPYLDVNPSVGRLAHGLGYYCRICRREFIVTVDRKHRRNLGWLKSSAERHSALCDELRQIADRMDCDQNDAKALRKRWRRQQNQEWKRKGRKT